MLSDTSNGHRPATPDGPFGGLNASEAGKRGAAARWAAAKEEELPDPKTMGPELLKELVQASMGRGRWHKLAIDKQLTALIKANEYVNGRPVAMKDGGDDQEPGVFSVGKRAE